MTRNACDHDDCHELHCASYECEAHVDREGLCDECAESGEARRPMRAVGLIDSDGADAGVEWLCEECLAREQWLALADGRRHNGVIYTGADPVWVPAGYCIACAESEEEASR